MCQGACEEVIERLEGIGPLFPPCGSREGIKLRLGYKCLYLLHHVVGSVFLLIDVYSDLVCIFNWIVCFLACKLSPIIRYMG